jgi:hypothetical protein
VSAYIHSRYDAAFLTLKSLTETAAFISRAVNADRNNTKCFSPLSIVGRLPFEVWRIILAFALPESLDDDRRDFIHEWDPTASSQDADLLRDKKSFSLVNRMWRNVSIEFLFRSVEISGIFALLRFVALLEESTEVNAKGRHVNRLHLKFVVPENWHIVYRERICVLLNVCPNLVTFVSMPILVSSVRPVPSTIVLALVESCGQSLRNVRFGGDEGISGHDAHHLLSHCPRLESFASITTFISKDWPSLGSRNSTLHTLRLHNDDRRRSDYPPKFSMDVNDFPSLKHLSIDRVGPVDPAAGLLRIHGRKLESLFWGISTDYLKENMGHFPNLRLLGLDTRPRFPGAAYFTIPAGHGKNINEIWFWNYHTTAPAARAPTVDHDIAWLNTIFSLPSLRRVCLPDVTTRMLIELYRTRPERQSFWRGILDYFVSRHVPLHDRDGVMLTSEIFGEQSLERDAGDSSGASDSHIETEEDDILEYTSDDEQIDLPSAQVAAGIGRVGVL